MAQPMIDRCAMKEVHRKLFLKLPVFRIAQEEGRNVRRRHQLAIHAHNYYNVCTI